jgi:hypothetical protein
MVPSGARTGRRNRVLDVLLLPWTARARRKARRAEEDAADLALIEERLRNPEGPPIPLEQVKRELGL